MFAIDVSFKDGSKIEGLIWDWSPKEGSFKVLDESNGKIKECSLSTVKNGIFYSDRIRKKAKQEELLEKARKEGFVD
jgi:fibronectin type 3 domain-containing protein